jgi:membrane peptidoglycan carboxypeptidase
MKLWRSSAGGEIAGGATTSPPPTGPAEGVIEHAPAAARPRRRTFPLGTVLIVILALSLALLGFLYEARTSRLQALLTHRLAARLAFKVDRGKSASLVLPSGPADDRLGYSRLADFEQSLSQKSYRIRRQASFSPPLALVARAGINPPYTEKSAGGLRLLDRHGEVLFDGTSTRHHFSSFEDIPDPIVPALLFIENRELFTDQFPYRNPAVEWDRLAHVAILYGQKAAGLGGDVQGGSTLATQIEKYRHSNAGLTSSPVEKLKQIASASLRAYRNDIDTRGERRQIVLNYLNTVPLSAVAGFGEVNGLGEAMWAWFGKDLPTVRQDLAQSLDGPGARRRAATSRELIALLVANRAPSEYLLRNRNGLEELVNVHLELMARAGVIDRRLAALARQERLGFRKHPPELPAPPFAERKAANAVRSQLLGLLGETSFYKLDRLDLEVSTTFDAVAQRAVTHELIRITDPKIVTQEGLRQFRLLERGDPSKVTYSFTFYEILPQGNLLRIQADNLGQPFDVNEGMKLDLGSTAKLRTLAHYLILVSDEYAAERGRRSALARARPRPAPGADQTPGVDEAALAAATDTAIDQPAPGDPAGPPAGSVETPSEEELGDEATAEAMIADEMTREAMSPYLPGPDVVNPAATGVEPLGNNEPDDSALYLPLSSDARDPITRFVRDYLAENPGASLQQVLDASLERRFSANPHERFFTGGGSHTFVNFNPADNGKIMTLREGLRNSVNLVFIRLMREIVQYHKSQLGYDEAAIFHDPANPERRKLLREFTDGEGRKLLWDYYHRYQGKGTIESINLLLRMKRTPRTVAIAHYFMNGPGGDPAELDSSLVAVLGPNACDPRTRDRLVKGFGEQPLNVSDAAYMLRVHPLELWTVSFLRARQDATWSDLEAASGPAIQSGYAWLYGKRARKAQDLRIHILLETKAFAEIHKVWQRLGYPFGSLVPSLATAIGSSADRPAALAELVGIIRRDGARAPTQRIRTLDFGTGTPYETRFEPTFDTPGQVMPKEVAVALRSCLVDVVENGTARRAYGAVKRPNGDIVPIGGKTGSGDNRIKSFARGGKLTGSRVVSRTASFAFFMGDRFYGVITAYVAGPEAAEFGFTSSLPTQILKMLGPALTPIVNAPPPGTKATPADLVAAVPPAF